MIRRPPRSTQGVSSAASDVYKRQPKAKTDINLDGNIDAADDALLDPGDDFGFNEGITYL